MNSKAVTFLGAVILSAQLTAQTITVKDSASPPHGLIGWWTGDGNVTDLTGRMDGTPRAIDFAAGKVGKAFRFDGTNSFVGVNNHAAFNAITNITFESWVWNDSARPFRRLLTLTPDWMVLSLQSGKLTFTVHYFDPADIATSATVSDTLAFPENSWHHVAATYDGKAVRLYVDGFLVGSKDALGKAENRGAAPGILINYMNTGEVGGLIDEVAVYSRALTPSEIESHFVADSAGMAKAPVIRSIGVFFPGEARLKVTGIPGRAITVQSSTDLLTWTPFGNDANTSGNVTFSDSKASGFGYKFYRVTQR